MSSKRKIEASRRNGARSRGPKTEAGKRRSSQNAIRHGLLAKRVVLENESEEYFQILLSQYIEKFEPADGVEFGMLEEMVSCYWRFHRGMMIEKALFNQALAKQNEDDPEDERTANAYRLLSDSPELKNLYRNMGQIHRMQQRALKSLLVLRDIGPDDTEEQNEPNPISGHSEQVDRAPSPETADVAGTLPQSHKPEINGGKPNCDPIQVLNRQTDYERSAPEEPNLPQLSPWPST